MVPEIWRRGSLLGPSLDDFIDRFFYGWPAAEREGEFSWSPRVDVHESDKEISLEVELPGLNKEDIKVEVRNNVLTISGERKYEKKSEKEESTRIERHYGKFTRSFGLPDVVETENISAEFKNGILSLNLKKKEKAIPKEISIQVK